MKYLICFITIIICVFIFCFCKKEKNIIRKGNGNIIIEYTNIVQEMANNESYIRIYDNKKVVYEDTYTNNKKELILNEEKYNEIINYAFSKKILSLEGKDISDSNVLDGYYKYITLYTEDKKEIRIGGSNPSNKYFNTLINMLRETIK